MLDFQRQYIFNGVSLYQIRNRNELRVIKHLGDIIREYPGYKPNDIDIQDIYARTLNNLPARYTQEGSIVLQEPLEDTTIRDSIREAVETIRQIDK